MARDALEKAKKAELVQKQIQEHLKKFNFEQKLLPSTTCFGARPLLIDHLGRILDESGNVVNQRPVIHSSLKVNRNLEIERQRKAPGAPKPAPSTSKRANDQQYVDPSLTVKRRKRISFKPVEPGSYVKQERQLQRQLEDRAFGINKKNLMVQKKRILEKQNQRLNAILKMSLAKEGVDLEDLPNVEEIDPNKIPIGQNQRLDKLNSWDEEEPVLEWWDRGVILLRTGEDPFKALGAKRHQPIVDVDPAACVVNNNKFTIYIQHPCKLDGRKRRAPAAPNVILTKKERKRLRRKKRQERLKRIQDKIRIGILPPPPPKLKLSNLMNVLKNQSVTDPSRVEQQVRRQMEERLRGHEERNEARRLTPEQRARKQAKKWQVGKHEDIEVALFMLKSLANSKLLFKVDINAQQYHLTGCCIVVNQGFSIIVVEGSKLSVRRYCKLLLRRIKWEEYELEEPPNDPSNPFTANDAFCKHIWTGNVKKKNFSHWSVSFLECEEEIPEALKPFKATHYYDMILKYRDPLEDV